jgi:hypothetical protein
VWRIEVDGTGYWLSEVEREDLSLNSFSRPWAAKEVTLFDVGRVTVRFWH